MMKSGTITVPPPTPKSPLKTPAAAAIAASFSVRLRGMPAIIGRVSVAAPLAEALEPLRADPARSAVLLDVDGVLAPIVRHADDAHVPEPTRRELVTVARRYGLVACASAARTRTRSWRSTGAARPTRTPPRRPCAGSRRAPRPRASPRTGAARS